MYKVHDIYRRDDTLWIVTKTKSCGGFDAVPLRDYILKNTRVELFNGDIFTLEELMQNSYDKFIENKTIIGEND